jgi:hypothetical protein
LQKKDEIRAPVPRSKTEAPSGEPKVSAFLYLASVLKEHWKSNKAYVKVVDLPTEAFSETEMLVQWTKYANV